MKATLSLFSVPPILFALAVRSDGNRGAAPEPMQEFPDPIVWDCLAETPEGTTLKQACPAVGQDKCGQDRQPPFSRSNQKIFAAGGEARQGPDRDEGEFTRLPMDKRLEEHLLTRVSASLGTGSAGSILGGLAEGRTR